MHLNLCQLTILQQKLEVSNKFWTWINNFYKPDYDYSDNRGFYERDSIANLIPLEYFKNVGTYNYIGKEYGFFIKTIINPNLPYIKINSVILFDIEVTFPFSSQYDTLTYEIVFAINECYHTRVRDGVDPADTNDVYQLTELQIVEDDTYVNIFGQYEGTIDLITYVSTNRYLGEYQREI